MARLCSYVVREDHGFAPNPFCGYCTLGVCTPNHQGSRLEAGDWIAGFTKARGHRFLYAMVIEEVLGLDNYFRDPAFARKKPELRGDWRARCGDSFYSRSDSGDWIQDRNRFHIGRAIQDQDTRYARVFIASRFWYFGRNALSPPSIFRPLIGGRGARVNHDPALVTHFQEWVEGLGPPGIRADPIDNPDRPPSPFRDQPY